MIQAMIGDLQEGIPPVRNLARASALRTAYGLRPCGMEVVRTACGRDVRVPRVGAVRTAAARQEPRPTDVTLNQ